MPMHPILCWKCGGGGPNCCCTGTHPSDFAEAGFDADELTDLRSELKRALLLRRVWGGLDGMGQVSLVGCCGVTSWVLWLHMW